MRRLPLLFASVLLLGGTACTSLYSDILRQDDPRLLVEVAPGYRLPYPDTPEGFLLLQGVGGNFSHRGRNTWSFDWAMPEGTPVLAARGGTVEHVEMDHGNQGGPLRLRKANLLKIRHDDGTLGVYAHLSQDSARVREGDRVAVGTPIAASGNTGFSTEPHLHFHTEDAEGRSIPISFFDCPEGNHIPRAGRRYRATIPLN